MILSKYGYDVEYTWYDLPNHNIHIKLDQFIVMPNHIHGIIIINGSTVGAGSEPAPTKKKHGLSEIIRQLQTFSARRINQNRNTVGKPVWQRNYYDHIIRNEESLHRIREYIIYNPLKWEFDKENPINWEN